MPKIEEKKRGKTRETLGVSSKKNLAVCWPESMILGLKKMKDDQLGGCVSLPYFYVGS